MHVDIKIGDIFKTNTSGLVEVLEYNDSRNILVRFSDGEVKACRADNLVRGKVRNVGNSRNIRGLWKDALGFVRYDDGRYASIDADGKPSYLYIRYNHVVKRATDEEYQTRYPVYKNCSLCYEWEDFQNFASWFTSQKGASIRDFQVDKDLLFKGNKHYSPDTCCVVPKEVNTVLTYRKPKRPGLPHGVHVHNPSGRYRTTCSDGGSVVHLGLFDSVEQAFYAYKKYKESILKCMAEKWRYTVEDKVYNALMLWEVLIDD